MQQEGGKLSATAHDFLENHALLPKAYSSSATDSFCSNFGLVIAERYHFGEIMLSSCSVFLHLIICSFAPSRSAPYARVQRGCERRSKLDKNFTAASAATPR